MKKTFTILWDRSRPSLLRWATPLALGFLGLATALLLRASATSDSEGLYRDFGLDDAIYYERVVADVAAGEGYYAAANRELHARGYETASTFNWRTPIYAHFLGWFGSPTGVRVALAVLALASALLAGRMVARDLGTGWGWVASGCTFAASAWWLRPEPAWFTETWAGQLILLSIAAMGLGWPRAGLAAGASALFLRELALPFVVLCLGDACLRRRWAEARDWSLSLVAYGAYFLVHESNVASYQLAERFRPSPGLATWVAWGGPGFLLATARMNYPLSWLPTWCAALYLPLAGLGLVILAAWDRPGRFVLLGFAGYLIGFLAVGQPFNFYWGWITAPTLALGFVATLAASTRGARRSCVWTGKGDGDEWR